MINQEVLHYCAASLPIVIGGIGGGLGLGIASSGTINAMTRQASGSDQCFRATLIGLALIESGSIISLVVTLLALIQTIKPYSLGFAFAETGISLGVGIAAAAISIASGCVVKAATTAIARQPFFAHKILTMMTLSQTIIEAPVILAFIVNFSARTLISPSFTLFEGLQFFSAGFVIALGCIGPSIGQAMFAFAACKAVGTNKNAYNKIFPFTLLNEALIETPMIFCLLFAFLILYSPTPTGAHLSILPFLMFLVAAITIGLGSLGSCISMGYVASKAVTQIACDINNQPSILRLSLLSIAFIESAVIYALIVALFILRNGPWLVC